MKESRNQSNPTKENFGKRIIDMSLQELKVKIKREKLNGFDLPYKYRGNHLKKCQKFFRKYKSLKDMPPEDLRIIMGVKLKGDLEYYEYRDFFGGLNIPKLKGFLNSKGNHYSPKSIIKISNALDTIPIEGEITKDQYDQFIQKLFNAMGYDIETSTSIALPSRLLAMKRPDQFLCLNAGNRKLIFDYSGIDVKNHANYWKLHQFIKLSKWYRQRDECEKLAPYIVAFIDSLTYGYTNR